MLYSYLMTNDSGFAPNPFFGYMTLANCKPSLRKISTISREAIREGIFVAGFTSKSLYERINKNPFNEPRLVFIMKISEKLTYENYWKDNRFQQKIPPVLGQEIFENKNSIGVFPKWNVGPEEEAMKFAGDNIYECLHENGHNYFLHHDNINHPCKYRPEKGLMQLGDCCWQPCNHQIYEFINPDIPSHYHNRYRKQIDSNGNAIIVDIVNPKDINSETVAQHDLKGLNVLISNEFFYFGSIPLDVINDFNLKVPSGQHSTGTITEDISLLWNYLHKTFEKNTRLNAPHMWPPNAPFN